MPSTYLTLVVLDLERHLAADAAERADAVDLAVEIRAVATLVIRHPLRASARRSGRPARIRRRPRRCCRPSGRARSKTDRRHARAPAMPITSLTCTSRQARTHRPHWIQASRLTASQRGCLSSSGTCRSSIGKAALDTPCARPCPKGAMDLSCALRALAGRRPAFRSPSCGPHWSRGLSVVTTIPSATVRECTTQPASARPRLQPYRRGSCRRGDSRALACGTDAGSQARAIRGLPDGHAFRRRRSFRSE